MFRFRTSRTMATIRQFLKPLLLPLFLASVVAIAEAHGGGNSTDTGTTPNLRSKSLILVKVYCLIIVFFATFLAGISPCFFTWNHGFLVLGTQFAGGVFLGTATMHFLADANDTFQSLTDKTYPFAFMLACSGYLLTMLGDCVVQWIFVKETSSPKVDVEMSPAPRVTPKATISNQGQDQGASCECESPAINPEAKTFVTATLVKKTNFGDTILLILALCFHSVFEGIAIGVAVDSNGAWRALWTISLHKIFAAIAMGIALLRMLPDRPILQCAIYAFAFAISSPIGVAIGIIIDATTQGPVADWVYAIAMGLACGVFIFVAINHLIAKGYVPQCKVRLDTPFYKLLAVTLGVGVIAVVMIWD